MIRRVFSLYLRWLATALAVLIVVGVGSAEAATVTLQWDANPETDIAGYIVSYGTTSGQYSTVVDVGNQLWFQFAEPNPGAIYYFAVRAYNTAGDQSPLSVEVNTSALTSPLSLSSISSNIPAPQTTGTTITFAASASGGTVPYQYKWLVYDGAAWTMAKDWSSSYSFAWTPTVANANYQVGVWVRSAGNTTDSYENPSSAGAVAYPISVAATPLSLTSLYSSLSAPQVAGTSVKFTAAAAGGTAPYQFKWLVSDGSSWTTVQTWSSANTFTWTPTSANANYGVGVWVRSATNTADAPENANAGSSMPYPITAPVQTITTGVAVTLSANMSAPQPAGTSIQFTAAATGASAYVYKWWIFDGSSWSVLRDWSSASTILWTPKWANSNYQILVRVANAAKDSDNAGASMAFPITSSYQGNGRRRWR
jgi:hypothetical protein